MTSPSYNTIRIEERGQSIWIFLSRPKALNALNSELLSELRNALTWIENEKLVQTRSVVITGDGKAFAAGADILQMQEFTYADALAFSKEGASLFSYIESFPRPVVAAVNGYCLGGGCELALACDFRYASNKAKFGQPEVSLGLIPGFSGTQRLPRLVGQAYAKELIYTGRTINATEALRIGLVNKVIAPEELIEEVEKVTRELENQSPNAIRIAKEAVTRGLQSDLNTGIAIENDLFAQAFTSPEKDEGIRAFIAKEKPNF